MHEVLGGIGDFRKIDEVDLDGLYLHASSGESFSYESYHGRRSVG